MVPAFRLVLKLGRDVIKLCYGYGRLLRFSSDRGINRGDVFIDFILVFDEVHDDWSLLVRW